MSALPSVETAVTPGGSEPEPARTRTPMRNPPALIAAVLAAWLLPVLTHLLGVDWLLLPLAVLATAALLRAGTTVLDRVVLAIALLYGTTLVAGLLFSVWPWHLHPVAVAGTGLTVLVAGYALTGRRPSLPRRWRGGDLAVLGGTAIAAAAALWPLLHRDLAGRLGTFIHVVDFSRHLMMFDAIRLSGGYMFLHKGTALGLVGEPGFLTYPQGGHFVAALTQNFLVSGTAAGPAQTWAGNFIWLLVAEYVGMCLMVLWGARHVAGRAASGWMALPLCGLVTAFLALGDPVTVFTRGYLQELPSLAGVAVLVAILSRPLARRREQVVLVGVLLAAISFTYYLFLPVAAALAAGWALYRWRGLLRMPVLTSVVAVLSLAAAAVIPLANRAASPGVVLLQGGQASPVDRGVVLALAALVVAGLAVLAGRRSAVGWFGLFAVLVTGVFVAVIDVYQRSQGGASYFGIKSLHEAMTVLMVLSGAALYLLRPLRVTAPGVAPPRRALLAVAVAALSVVPLAASGVDVRYAPGPGMRYIKGWTTHETLAARNALAVYRAHPRPDDRTVVVLDGGLWPQYLGTLYYGVLTHRFANAATFTNGILPWIGKHPDSQVERRIIDYPTRTRVFVSDPAQRERLRNAAAKLPAGRMEVLDLATVR